MVYCTKCGTKNEDDAIACVQCGETLSGTRRTYAYRKERDACFGGAFGGAGWILFIGLAILLWGVAQLFEPLLGLKIDFWPLLLIILGVMVIVGVLTTRRRY